MTERFVKESETTPQKMIIFILMGTTAISFDFLGKVYLSELVLFFVTFYAVLRGKVPRIDYQAFRIAKQLLMLALSFQVLTDVIRQTPIQDSIKGSALIVFAFSNLVGFQSLSRGSRVLAGWGLLGFLTGFATNLLFFQTEYLDFAKLWKYGLGYCVTLSFLVVSQLAFKTNQIITPFILIALSLFSLSFNSRNLAFISFLSALWFLFSIKKKTYVGALKQFRRLIVVLIVSLFLSSVIYNQYLLNSSGINSEVTKFINQGTGPTILLKGRTEIVSQSLAIQQSPLIGHGSYALNTDRLKESISLTLEDLGFSNFEITYFFNFYKGKIPVHSALFQFYVWFGLGAIFFWLYLLHSTTRVLSIRSIPLYLVFLSINLVWDALFSPFGSISRLSFMVSSTLILIHLAIEKENQRDSSSTPIDV